MQRLHNKPGSSSSNPHSPCPPIQQHSVQASQQHLPDIAAQSTTSLCQRCGCLLRHCRIAEPEVAAQQLAPQRFAPRFLLHSQADRQRGTVVDRGCNQYTSLPSANMQCKTGWQHQHAGDRGSWRMSKHAVLRCMYQYYADSTDTCKHTLSLLNAA